MVALELVVVEESRGEGGGKGYLLAGVEGVVDLWIGGGGRTLRAGRYMLINVCVIVGVWVVFVWLGLWVYLVLTLLVPTVKSLFLMRLLMGKKQVRGKREIKPNK